MSTPVGAPASARLAKQLGLWDVYSVSTGAMFSSGFFLLPGIATAYAGPSTALAYLVAGLLMIPAMLSMAELATALPRAGGTYYFLDRGLGPAAGAIGGIGTWLALVLKSGFALLGMGAYLATIPSLSHLVAPDNAWGMWNVRLLAVVLTILFAAVNIVGAKQSTRTQGFLVALLLFVLGFFVLQGLWYVFWELPPGQLSRQYSPFFHEENGVAGVVSTVGLVFVSYAGLTKVASISEEVRRPERNLPLGMFLSLATATFVYVVGVFIMIAVLDRDELRQDLTPVASAAESFFSWLPYPIGLLLIVAAALAAFASTGNAGIMSASRYPLAMARDKLMPAPLQGLGRFGTPTRAIVLTSLLMIVFILFFSAEDVAKLASGFNLLVFALVNLVVIVMRESRIESYDPGFRSPLYPWVQISGTLISIWLIIETGWLPVLLDLAVIFLGFIWYWRYARSKVERYGAIHHVFERLGRYRHEPLATEFRQILKEKGVREEDPFDILVARAPVLDYDRCVTLEEVSAEAAQRVAEAMPAMDADEASLLFAESGRQMGALGPLNVMLPHFRSAQVNHAELVLVRLKCGLSLLRQTPGPEGRSEWGKVFAAFFLISPESESGEHLRILAHIASRAEEESFVEQWQKAQDHQELREVLLRDDRFLALHLSDDSPASELIGRPLFKVGFPKGSLIVLIRRDDEVFVPAGDTVLSRHDRLTIVGNVKAIRQLRTLYTPS